MGIFNTASGDDRVAYQVGSVQKADPAAARKAAKKAAEVSKKAAKKGDAKKDTPKVKNVCKGNAKVGTQTTGDVHISGTVRRW